MSEHDINYIYGMMLRRLLLFLLIAASFSVSGQYTKEFKRIYFDATYLYETGFYNEAFSRYKNLLTLDPGNSNILFHCGACCLNIPGNELQAITYLEESVKGVTTAYKDNSHKEPGSPVITHFMLARAYHLNGDFDKAIISYNSYLDTGGDEDPQQLQYARLQIEACLRAALIVDNSPSFEFQSVLDQFDDDLPSCNNPVISGDGNILIFLVDYPNDKKIMMTVRGDKLWSRPRVINSEIGMVGETYPVSLSYDGQELYLVHQFYSHSDIFVSRFEGGRWSEAEALGHNVNGRTSETHASISRDGNTLYFTSDVRGGYGSFDIYVSKLDDKGEWGLPVNLGPGINTTFEEHTPFISSNDSILFFSSQGHASIGGIDVYYSELESDGNWGEPINLGYPVNTTGEDLFFNPGWDELDGFYAVRREDDPGSNTINMVIKLEPEEVVAEVQTVEETPEQPEEEPEAQPEEEPKAQGKEVVPNPVVVAATVELAIEPPETDEIEEVLNRDAVEPPPPQPAATPLLPEAPLGPTLLETSLPFEHNKYELNMAAMLEVERLAELLVVNPEAKVELTGHSDHTGRDEYNMLLSLQRVDQVAQYLEMRGIPKDRIALHGKGEKAPVAWNRYPDGEDAPLGRYLNRMVFARVVSENPMVGELKGTYLPPALKFQGESYGSTEDGFYWFTIQLKSSYGRAANMARFQGAGDVVENRCKDGYYRYTTGSFKDFWAAKELLQKIQKLGYEDSYIQTMDYYERMKK